MDPAILSRLERTVKNRSGEYYVVGKCQDKGGMCMKASREILKGEPVLVERILFKCPAADNHPSLVQRPDFVALFNSLSEIAMAHAHLHGPERYPPTARRLMDQIAEMNKLVGGCLTTLARTME